MLVAEIARRLANLLRAAVEHDPFIPQTARALTGVARITALGGFAVWAAGSVAAAALSATMLTSGTAVESHGSPFGWLAVGRDPRCAGHDPGTVRKSRRDGGQLVESQERHARALRFTTLSAICDAVGCTAGDLLGLQQQSADPRRVTRPETRDRPRLRGHDAVRPTPAPGSPRNSRSRDSGIWSAHS